MLKFLVEKLTQHNSLSTNLPFCLKFEKNEEEK